MGPHTPRVGLGHGRGVRLVAEMLDPACCPVPSCDRHPEIWGWPGLLPSCPAPSPWLQKGRLRNGPLSPGQGGLPPPTPSPCTPYLSLPGP